MQEYTVRSTRTKRGSAVRRAADIAVVLLLCAGLVAFLFGVVLVPMRVGVPAVFELEEGELLLVDRVSKYLSDYSVGDIVRAETEAGEGVYRVAAPGGSSYIVRYGKAYLNGELIGEEEYSEGWAYGVKLSFTVPEDEILLLPDDRTGITELSGWSVPYNSIYGEVRFRIAPLNRLAFFI